MNWTVRRTCSKVLTGINVGKAGGAFNFVLSFTTHEVSTLERFISVSSKKGYNSSKINWWATDYTGPLNEMDKMC